MNCIQIIGRIAREPDVKFTPNGKKVCTFSVAVQRKFKNTETNEYDADFFNVCAWEARAEFVEKYFHKGQRVGISGTLQTRSYTDKNGNPATWYEIVAEGIDFADGKQQQDNSAANNAPPPQTEPPKSSNNPAQTAPPWDGDYASIPDEPYPF